MAEIMDTITSSKEYVAYKLAQNIMSEEYNSEHESQKIKQNYREHYLDLYVKCLDATNDRRRVKD